MNIDGAQAQPKRRARGELKQRIRSRGAFAPELCRKQFTKRPPQKGSEAPKGASNQCPRGAIRCCHLKALAARKRPMSGAARLPALHSGACQSDRTLQLSPGRASREREDAGVTHTPSIALKRSTPRPGRSAGGDDAQTARERGYEPRPQEPHSLHRSAVAGDVPSMSETCIRNTNGDDSQRKGDAPNTSS